jgi:Co/Zn/Cd efflux system component
VPGSQAEKLHRHGVVAHRHRHAGPHWHAWLPWRSRLGAAGGESDGASQPHHDEKHDHPHPHADAHGHEHSQPHDHGHSHGVVDRSIVRSRDGVRTVAISLLILGATAVAQSFIFVASGSVALLADLIHNFGDALTAVPLGIAFYVRSFRAEKIAGGFVVLAIFVSACVALYETVQRLIHPQPLTHLWALAAAGLIGFVGNEIAAQVRLRGGRRLHSPALIADGNHARTDGYVSLGVVASAVLVGLGFDRADPLVGLAITLVILKITWDSWRLISTTEPGAPVDHEQH